MPRTAELFPPRKRLSRPKEYARVFARPVRSSDRYFTVLARANEDHMPRLGLTISRRAARRAVDRNMLKRLAREAFRSLPELPPMDFVVLAKPEAAAADKRVLRQSLDKHFRRLGARGTAGNG